MIIKILSFNYELQNAFLKNSMSISYELSWSYT